MYTIYRIVYINYIYIIYIANELPVKVLLTNKKKDGTLFKNLLGTIYIQYIYIYNIYI